MKFLKLFTFAILLTLRAISFADPVVGASPDFSGCNYLYSPLLPTANCQNTPGLSFQSTIGSPSFSVTQNPFGTYSTAASPAAPTTAPTTADSRTTNQAPSQFGPTKFVPVPQAAIAADPDPAQVTISVGGKQSSDVSKVSQPKRARTYQEAQDALSGKKSGPPQLTQSQASDSSGGFQVANPPKREMSYQEAQQALTGKKPTQGSDSGGGGSIDAQPRKRAATYQEAQEALSGKKSTPSQPNQPQASDSSGGAQVVTPPRRAVSYQEAQQALSPKKTTQAVDSSGAQAVAAPKRPISYQEAQEALTGKKSSAGANAPPGAAPSAQSAQPIIYPEQLRPAQQSGGAVDPSENHVEDIPPFVEHNGAVSYPVQSNVLPNDAGQTQPLTPILPAQSTIQKLESYCPDCARTNDASYQQKFAGFKDIKDQIGGVGNILKNAAHDMMKIVHLNCSADKIFVPTDYVTDLTYCGGLDCDRMGSKATDTYFPDQIKKFKNDQVTGDIYRAPLQPGVANIKVGNSKGDTRTCQDLHDRPFMFQVGGHPGYSNGKLDPFDYNSQKSITDGQLNLADCSSTVNAVFAASGLKFSPKDTTPASSYNKSTGALVALAFQSVKDKNSCVSIPEFKGDESIHTGDVFVLQRNVEGKTGDIGHALMFDDVKEDPFNLAGISKPEDCVGQNSKIDPSQFRFSILQSSGTTVDRQVFERFKGIDLTVEQHYDDLGPTNSKPCSDYDQPSSCDMRARFEDWGAHIIRMAQRACLAKTSPGKSFKPTETLESRNKALSHGKEVPANISGVLIRHKGPSDACSFAKPPEILGAKCVAGCLSK